MKYLNVLSAIVLTLAATTIFTTNVLAQTTSPDPTLTALHSSVEYMTTQLTTQAQSMPEKQKDKLLGLVKKQKEQFDTVEAKHKADTHPLSKKQLNAELSEFFSTGRNIQTFLLPPKGSIQALEYSPDPQQCANHCYNSCGYNTLGEKVCWYTCYKCCGSGGC